MLKKFSKLGRSKGKIQNKTMKGQWLGAYSGDVAGTVMVNVDEVEDHYEGTAYLIPARPKDLPPELPSPLPASVARFITAGMGNSQKFMAHFNAIDPRNGQQSAWENIKSLFAPEIFHPATANISAQLRDGKLIFKGITDLKMSFEAHLEQSANEDVSKIVGQQKTWGQFKTHVTDLSKSKFIFRGQKRPWRLCTNFHRRGRCRINTFVGQDVPMLHQRLSSITSHFFQLADGDQNGAFFNLLQHHGYPTPLLDWSLSPYVAAFFAFRDRPIDYKKDEFVRIYIFNHREWKKHFPTIHNLDPVFPHLSVMEFMAIDNRRMVPQQAVTTVTNLDDVEAYILKGSEEQKITFLEAIDIPASERDVAMQDLRFMGITAGSMFPGIDGVCEEFREINFG